MKRNFVPQHQGAHLNSKRLPTGAFWARHGRLIQSAGSRPAGGAQSFRQWRGRAPTPSRETDGPLTRRTQVRGRHRQPVVCRVSPARSADDCRDCRHRRGCGRQFTRVQLGSDFRPRHCAGPGLTPLSTVAVREARYDALQRKSAFKNARAGESQRQCIRNRPIPRTPPPGQPRTHRLLQSLHRNESEAKRLLARVWSQRLRKASQRPAPLAVSFERFRHDGHVALLQDKHLGQRPALAQSAGRKQNVRSKRAARGTGQES